MLPSPLGALINEGLDDCERLLLLFAQKCSYGRQLFVQLRLRSAFQLLSQFDLEYFLNRYALRPRKREQLR
jgi:hypothetical protein